MSTPIRLPLSQRQAAALAVLLEWFDGFGGGVVDDPDELAALREVAGKLDTLREKP